jgi:hypothetical protein
MIVPILAAVPMGDNSAAVVKDETTAREDEGMAVEGAAATLVWILARVRTWWRW